MHSPTYTELDQAFRAHGYEPPPEFKWLVEHQTLGFDAFTQLEPWHFCGVLEILPLAVRWPKAGIKRDLVPFARLQGSDDLACFEYVVGKVVRVCHVHYGLPSTAREAVHFEITHEYSSTWEWLHAAVDEMKEWFESTNTVAKNG